MPKGIERKQNIDDKLGSAYLERIFMLQCRANPVLAFSTTVTVLEKRSRKWVFFAGFADPSSLGTSCSSAAIAYVLQRSPNHSPNSGFIGSLFFPFIQANINYFVHLLHIHVYYQCILLPVQNQYVIENLTYSCLVRFPCYICTFRSRSGLILYYG